MAKWHSDAGLGHLLFALWQGGNKLALWPEMIRQSRGATGTCGVE